jgi:putative ABC transport system permease protein
MPQPGLGLQSRVQATVRGQPQPRVQALGRRFMRPADVVATALLGPRTRKARAALSALGIAIGIAALVSLVGIPASQTEQMRREMDAQGANLIVVFPAETPDGEVIPIPETAPAMINRIGPVNAVFALRELKDTYAFRNDFLAGGPASGVRVGFAEGNLLKSLRVEMSDGAWFDQASTALPTVVLGSGAAEQLGVQVGARVSIDSRWWAVIGVLEPMKLAEEIDTMVFLAPEEAKEAYNAPALSAVYVAARPGSTKAVHAVTAATVSPDHPEQVNVTGLSDYYGASELMEGAFRNMSLGLGAVALLVGGIGIANTMVVAVMERRGEVGLRRAMGARTGQITLQFAFEAGAIGLIGGIMGVALGAYAVFCFTAWSGIAFSLPLWVVLAGPAVSVVLGVVAGLYPAFKAARLPPTTALRAY